MQKDGKRVLQDSRLHANRMTALAQTADLRECLVCHHIEVRAACIPVSGWSAQATAGRSTQRRTMAAIVDDA